MGFKSEKLVSMPERLMQITIAVNEILGSKHREGKQTGLYFHIKHLGEMVLNEEDLTGMVSLEMSAAMIDTSSTDSVEQSIQTAMNGCKDHSFFIFESPDRARVFVTVDKRSYVYTVRFVQNGDHIDGIAEGMSRICGVGTIEMHTMPGVKFSISIPEYPNDPIDTSVNHGDIAGRAMLFAGEQNGTLH